MKEEETTVASATVDAVQWVMDHGLNAATLLVVLIGTYKLNFRLNELLIQHKEFPPHIHIEGGVIPPQEIIYPVGLKRK